MTIIESKGKKIVMALIVIAVLFAFPIRVFATESVTYSGSFSDKWTKFHSVDLKNGTKVRITYGFNTFLINEDTIQAYNDGYKHRARIMNGNGTHYGPWKYANDYSDLEVRHSGTKVTYSDCFGE